MKPLLLVDGYNVIGAWDVPRAEHLSIEESRERLVHLIADYAGYSGEEVIVVFDGHYTDRPTRSRQTWHGVEVVYTKHAESADNFIESACAAAPKWRQVRVATSDAVEQTVTLGRGAVRISSREFLLELTQVRSAGRGRMREEKVSRGDIFSRLPPHQREIFDRMRKGEE
ncbi:MAG: NYN domain-containing protein [Clostridia bacterium]|nr:NYN domain-containing protein [Clostridia bacterium]